jgi:ribonuclease R
MAAERDSTDRYVAAYMADRVGAEFPGRVTGVTRFGLFVRLAETGAEGLIPIRSLGGEFFRHDERAQALVGERSRHAYRMGDALEVTLEEAAPVTGGLRFALAGVAGAPAPKTRSGRFRPEKKAKKGGFQRKKR